MNNNSNLELLWWIKHLEIFNGTFLLKQAPQAVLQMDASLIGLGAALQRKSIGGTWSFQERKWHINELELLAVELVLRTFLKSQNYFNSHTNGQHSGFDISEKKNGGGTKNQKMTILSKEIWEILISEQIMITVEYLPSSLNKVPDLESRCTVDSSKWVLCRPVFCNLCLKLGTLTVELVSHQLAQYVAWKPEPYNIATDVMSIPWTQYQFLGHRVIAMHFPHFV